MTVRELINKLLDHPSDLEVCSATKDPVTFGVLESDGSVMHLITLDRKKDLKDLYDLRRGQVNI